MLMFTEQFKYNKKHSKTSVLFFPLCTVKSKFIFLFKLNTFLTDIERKDKRSLDWRQTIDTEYDILNIWNLPKGLGLKVKIGSFSANAPQGQQLSLSEQMIQWPAIFSEVGYVLSKWFVLILLILFCSVI